MTKIAAARRTLLTGAALAVAGVLIAGCASQGSSSSAPAQATSAVSAVQAPPTSPAAAPTTPADSAPAGSAGPASARAPTTHSSGEFFLNDCDPSCAQGHDQTYPVHVTLSVVYSSPYGGTYFGQASLTWPGNRPPAGTKSTYVLPDPSGL